MRKLASAAAGEISKQIKAIAQSELPAPRPAVSPLEFLVRVYQDAEVELKDRIRAAEAAAPYMHRRQPQDLRHSGVVDLAHTIVLQEARPPAMIELAGPALPAGAEEEGELGEAAERRGRQPAQGEEEEGEDE